MNKTDNPETANNKTTPRRLKPGLPKFQRGNVISFVEQTVLADTIKNMNFNFEQYTNLLAVRNLISACILYLTDIMGEDNDWNAVYNMLDICIDDAHQVLADNPLSAIIKNAPGADDRCYFKTLYDSALTGGAYHIPSTFGRALRLLADYIYC